MHRIDTSTAQRDKFGAGKNGFTTGDPQSGTPATEVSAEILDALQEEIAAVIEDPESGLTLSKSNNGQLIAAIKKIVTAKAAPDASETQKGIARFATAKESADAESGTLSVPPKHLPAVIAKYAPVAGGYRALKLSADGVSANVVISAEQLVLDAVSGAGALLAKNVAVTAVANASGLNGLDTGSLAASTWYSVWVISNGTTVASLLSLSATAPTMPNGYTHRRRVGWIITDASANRYPIAFVQAGSFIRLLVTSASYYPLMASGVAGTLSSSAYTPVSVSTSAFVPVTASGILIKGGLTGAATSVVAYSSTQYGWGGWDSLTNPPEFLCPDNSSPDLVTLAERNIYWAANTASARLWCTGWEDQL